MSRKGALSGLESREAGIFRGETCRNDDGLVGGKVLKKKKGMRTGAEMMLGGGQKASLASIAPYFSGKNGEFASLVGRRFPYVAVFLFCVVFAIQLGVQEPNLHFQKTGAQVLVGCSTSLSFAYAAGNQLLLYVPDENASSVHAAFEGNGNIDGVVIGKAGSSSLNLSSLRINGLEVCDPCDRGRHLLGRSAGGKLEVDADFYPVARPLDPPLGGGAFFEKQLDSYIEAPLEIEVVGGWVASSNAAMPSSFYGIDAPFHIHAIKEMGEKIRRWQIPPIAYPFAGDIGGTVIYLALGTGSEYAYKLYNIALFFVPIALFLLFSRRLGAYAGSAFLFASLIYLYLPPSGYPMGGGTDLFIYGMTPHTLATYLSLFFLYFAYGFVFEKKGVALPSALFLFAIMANPRILFSLAIMLAVLAAMALAHKKLGRVALLSAACAGACGWFLAGTAQAFDFGGYGVVEGAAIDSQLQGAMAFLQSGYAVLPVLFAAGSYFAIKRKSLFLACLASVAIVVLLCATSPEINQVVPFLDGLRFLPSFFLPMFFVCGFGAAVAFEALVDSMEGLAKMAGMDRITMAGAVLFGLLLPFAVLSASIMLLAGPGYHMGSPTLAAEYQWLREADSIVGGRVAFDGRGEISQYPVYEKITARSSQAGTYDADKLYELMRKNGQGIVIFGNNLKVDFGSNESLRQYYEKIVGDGRFAELVSSGPGRAVALREESMGSSLARKEASYRVELFALGVAALALCAVLAGREE